MQTGFLPGIHRLHSPDLVSRDRPAGLLKENGLKEDAEAYTVSYNLCTVNPRTRVCWFEEMQPVLLGEVVNLTVMLPDEAWFLVRKRLGPFPAAKLRGLPGGRAESAFHAPAPGQAIPCCTHSHTGSPVLIGSWVPGGPMLERSGVRVLDTGGFLPVPIAALDVAFDWPVILPIT